MRCVNISIGVDKPTGLGIVVTGLEIVQSGVGIVVISAIAERIEVGYMRGVSRHRYPAAIGDRFGITPYIVLVRGYFGPGGVNNLDHIPLTIVDITYR